MRAAGICAGLWLLAVLPGGCAKGPGDWVTTLVPGGLSARLLAPAQRVTTDGWLLTAEGTEVQFAALALTAGPVELSGDAEQVLVSLGVDGALPVATRVPSAPVGSEPFSGCVPGCGLSPGVLTQAGVALMRLYGRGQFRVGATGATQAFTLDLRLDGNGMVVTQALQVAVVLGGPAQTQLNAGLALPAGLLDGVDLNGLPAHAGAHCLESGIWPVGSSPQQDGCADAAAALALRGNLAQTALDLELSAAPQED